METTETAETNCRLCGRIIGATVAKCPHCDAVRVPEVASGGPDWAVIGLFYLISVVGFPYGFFIALGGLAVYYMVFGRSRSSRVPEPEDATTRRLKVVRVVGGFIAISGIGVIRLGVAFAAKGPLFAGAALVPIGGIAAWKAHRGLKR